MADIAYRRVSTLDQNLGRQLDGFLFEEEFEDKASGKDTKRPGWEECRRYLRKGDTLHVHSIDRLARSLKDLEEILESLRERGVSIKFHKENLTFSTKADPFQELQFRIIGAVAQFERAMIRERQREGIAKAKKEGKHLGRAPLLTKMQEAELCRRANAGENKQDLADEYGISRPTVYAILKRTHEKRLAKGANS